MPPREKSGANTKKESGRAKKAENEAKKKETAAADKERKDAEAWQDGARAAKADKEEKRKAELARKAENARLLAQEEASNAIAKKPAPKGAKKGAKAATKPAGPDDIAADDVLSADKEKEDDSATKEVESFAATGIDDALELLDVVTAKTDKASVGQQAAGIEAHPERRFKAAFEAYQERELPELRVDQPGLRLQQYKEIMYKNFQKSPDNPFNQTSVSYDATKEEKVKVLKAKQAQVEDRLRV